MTIQEFKKKAETDEALKKGMTEAVGKGEEALAAFLEEQGVDVLKELPDEEMGNVAGGGKVNEWGKRVLHKVADMWSEFLTGA